MRYRQRTWKNHQKDNFLSLQPAKMCRQPDGHRGLSFQWVRKGQVIRVCRQLAESIRSVQMSLGREQAKTAEVD